MKQRFVFFKMIFVNGCVISFINLPAVHTRGFGGKACTMSSVTLYCNFS